MRQAFNSLAAFAVSLLPISVLAADASPLPDARKLLLTGRYEEAAERYRQLQREYPVEAALGLARCHRAAGRLKEAESALQTARKEILNNADLTAEVALLAFERGVYEEARSLADAALKVNASQLTARWISAELHRVAGRMDEADQGYEWFVDYYNDHDTFAPDDLRWIGLAAAQYARWNRNSGQFRFLVSELYPQTLKLDEHYWPARLEMALLFLEKYNAADAKAELSDALAINPHAAEVHAARARLALQDFDLPAARQSLDQALAINPQLLAAHQLRADVLLAELRIDEAIAALEQARGIDPVDEETLGRLAAAYGAVDGLGNTASDSRMAKLIDEVVGRNPHCGDFFMALADSLDRMRRYPDAARYYREAAQRMPQLLYARGQLGLLLMRLGDEAEAARLLEEAFRVDPFNVRVRNLLEVLDVLHGYAAIETDHFVIKFDRGADEILARYAARYLEEVYPPLVRELGFEPPQKTLIEIFSRAKNTSGHGWFSARMVGLPFLGTVGACAGQVVAIASPNDLGEKYHWARVLKHEFVHVVTLQQTDFNIPHWYTEGLAVRAEGLDRPTRWNEVLARRTRDKTLLDLDSINLGFIRPRNSDEWALAYCQAELYTEFMEREYGAGSLAKMLAAYGDSLNTAAAIRRCFGVEQPQFEDGYRRYVEQLVAGFRGVEMDTRRSVEELEQAVREKPEDADSWAELAREHLRRRDNENARRCATEARNRRENHQLASYVLARLALSSGDKEQATQILRESLDEQSPESDALALLANLAAERSDWAEAERLYERGAAKYPDDEKWMKLLSRVYLQSGDAVKLRQSLRKLAEKESDSFVIRKKLLELAVAGGDWDDAVRWGREALHIDVMDADVHASLGRAFSKQKKYTEAVEEFEIAVQVSPTDPDLRVLFAETLAQAGQEQQAIRVLEQLLAKYPQHEPAKRLLAHLTEQKL